jgi:hypothetical protein
MNDREEGATCPFHLTLNQPELVLTKRASHPHNGAHDVADRPHGVEQLAVGCREDRPRRHRAVSGTGEELCIDGADRTRLREGAVQKICAEGAVRAEGGRDNRRVLGAD